MAIKFITVKIRKNELCTLEESYSAWEIPLLEALFDQIERVGEFTVDRPAPTADEEYSRLLARYPRPAGEDGTPQMPLVVSVYGAHAVGLASLKREIDASVVEHRGFDDLLAAS